MKIYEDNVFLREKKVFSLFTEVLLKHWNLLTLTVEKNFRGETKGEKWNISCRRNEKCKWKFLMEFFYPNTHRQIQEDFFAVDSKSNYSIF